MEACPFLLVHDMDAEQLKLVNSNTATHRAADPAATIIIR